MDGHSSRSFGRTDSSDPKVDSFDYRGNVELLSKAVL